MLRLMAGQWGHEIAYAKLGITGLQAEIEFPSDWHETRRAWMRFGLGLLKIAFSFPWPKTVPDEGQCSGPTYGFHFHSDYLWLHYGKSIGRRGDPHKAFKMPWRWRHVNDAHKILSEPEKHPYFYRLRGDGKQEVTATIHVETRTWVRPWIPWKMVIKSIEVSFDDEVGDRAGSWKGGTVGCGYTMKPNETALDCLRRMERERVFT